MKAEGVDFTYMAGNTMDSPENWYTDVKSCFVVGLNPRILVWKELTLVFAPLNAPTAAKACLTVAGLYPVLAAIWS